MPLSWERRVSEAVQFRPCSPLTLVLIVLIDPQVSLDASAYYITFETVHRGLERSCRHRRTVGWLVFACDEGRICDSPRDYTAACGCTVRSKGKRHCGRQESQWIHGHEFLKVEHLSHPKGKFPADTLQKFVMMDARTRYSILQ